MKSRKILAFLLAAVMLFSVMSISISAEWEPGIVYTGSETHKLTTHGSISETLFNVDLEVNENKFTCFDGGSKNWSKEIKSVVISYQVATFDNTVGEVLTADYVTDPEAFFEIVARQEEDRAAIEKYNANLIEGQPEHDDVEEMSVKVDFEIAFEDPTAFGTLEYTVILDGVMEPPEMDIPLLGDVLSAARLPTTIKLVGTIWNFPVIDAPTIQVLKNPSKNTYKDNEIYELDGTKISFSVKRALTNDKNTAYTTVGSGELTYSPNNSAEGKNDANAYMFTCHPARGTKLTVNTTSVVTYFSGYEIGKAPVNVSHKWSDGYVNITTDKWLYNKPGYHAIICEGCGETKDAQNHVVPEEEENAWTPNGDQSFVGNGTESTPCLVCGATLTRDVNGSADYNNVFANYHFLKVIFDYINLILRVIGNAGIN